MEPSTELAFTRRPKGEISCRMDVLEFRSGSERNGEATRRRGRAYRSPDAPDFHVWLMPQHPDTDHLYEQWRLVGVGGGSCQ